MCPACIASAAVIVVGAGSLGGVLAMCIRKFTQVFGVKRVRLRQQAKEQ